LACLPTWGARWLVPRLSGFLAENPHVTVNILTRLVPFDFAADPFDAAIHFGPPDWPGARMQRLQPEWVMPMCAPGVRDRFGFGQPADLLAAPLLHLTTRPDAWERYLSFAGCARAQVSGALFDQFATLASAAVAGIGIALLPLVLTEDERSTGRLVPAMDLGMESADAYHLVWPPEREAHPPLVAFRGWLARQVMA
jgi:LysR family glycine cleavage system transcriptional activator